MLFTVVLQSKQKHLHTPICALWAPGRYDCRAQGGGELCGSYFDGWAILRLFRNNNLTTIKPTLVHSISFHLSQLQEKGMTQPSLPPLQLCCPNCCHPLAFRADDPSISHPVSEIQTQNYQCSNSDCHIMCIWVAFSVLVGGNQQELCFGGSVDDQARGIRALAPPPETHGVSGPAPIFSPTIGAQICHQAEASLYEMFDPWTAPSSSTQPPQPTLLPPPEAAEPQPNRRAKYTRLFFPQWSTPRSGSGSKMEYLRMIWQR